MRKNKIVIICTITVLLVALIVFGVLYLKTDFLKSDETLFYKYLSKTQILNPELTQRYKNMYEKVKQSNYSSSGNISYSVTKNDLDTNIANIQEILAARYNVLNNISLKQAYADVTLSSLNQNITTIRYLKDNNTYGIKIDNVVNKYLAVKNEKLKNFITKLGIEDTSKIPDEIPTTSLEELLRIDDTTLKNTKTTYINLVKEKINKNNFKKIKNSNGTRTFEISLSEKEVKEIEKALLEQLKNDETVLNLVIEKMQKVGYELNIDSIKTSIQEEIDDITNNNYSEEKGFFKLALTENDKEVTKIDITATIEQEEQDETYSIDNSENKTNEIYNISIDLTDKNKIPILIKTGEEISRVIISLGYNDTNITTNIEIVELDEQLNPKKSGILFQYQVDNYNSDDIVQNALITLNYEGLSKTQISMSNNIQIKQDINIEKITDNNSAILNDKQAEELQQLFFKIQKRIEYLYGEKLEMFLNS